MGNETFSAFSVGDHRPVYFWGGPSTVMMNQLKFMGAPVNEALHLAAHTPEAAQLLVDAGFNWAYLMYNWGFPPEMEQEQAQRESFQQAVDVFHKAGLQVFGYVQLSNCVYAGTHREKDWYARDPRGKLIYYYTGRYMTCWHHPEWRQQLRHRVCEIVETGADGVFFDNPWMGMHILSLLGTWITGAGCYCERCREAYRRHSGGQDIPVHLDPGDLQTQDYLAWRAGVVWGLVDELADYARSLRADIVIAENVYDAVNCNHYADFGVDLREAARISDLVMIEDHSFPRLANDGAPVVNSITCKAARAWSSGTPVSTNPYIAGIGFDPVYTPRQFRRAVAEGAACGVTTIVKGTEFFDRRDGGFTLLTGEPFEAQRKALADIHRWLADHAHLYRQVERREISPLAIYFPYDTLPFDWQYTAPLVFGACQTLLLSGYPYRIVGPGDWDGVETLLVPPIDSRDDGGADLEARLRAFTSEGGRIVALGEGEGRPSARLVWSDPRPIPAFLQYRPALRSFLGRIVMALYRAYFSCRVLRHLLDRTNVTQRVLQGGSTYNPLFRPPATRSQEALLDAIGPVYLPRVQADLPVAIEWWRRDSSDGLIDQLHLVNYADSPQKVEVSLPWVADVRLISPDTSEATAFEGRSLRFTLDLYTVLLCERAL